VTPKRGEWTVEFVGFSLQGWTDDAKELAESITADGEARKNWRSHSFRLLNLEDVYADLKKWFPLGDG